MELKRYQKRVLEDVRRFLEALTTEVARGNRHATMDAWLAATKRELPNRARQNGLHQDLPSFCIKVPTGGGKTLLATQILGQLHSTLLRDRNGSGLVLWIVPSDQIYKDTLKRLRDRRDPLREMLEFAVASRIEVWEKDEIARLTPVQLRGDLNILVLKLASANRGAKDQLKMFQDSGGNIVQHFPPEDDAAAQHELKKRCENLEMITEDLARTSLANLLRLCRPAVILDEGHKAYSKLAQETLGGFNPAIIVELSATPDKARSNILTQVSGKDLLAEDMIKLPINIAISGEASWKNCLAKARDQRELLAQKARAAGAGSETIRPIVLVQVERTGEKQRDAGLVHAEDVKQHLIEKLGVSDAEIAIKSSEKDDIEGIDLMDEGCPITWIITKSALQEGWDCPFAYILVSLNNTQSSLSMTQLVGRVLRQPFARKTGTSELDESYVYCLRRRAADVMHDVKKALESEGYEGDAASVIDRSDPDGGVPRRTSKFRSPYERIYRPFKGKVYLPRFCVKSSEGYEGLDYFRHLVSTVDVDQFDYGGIKWDLQAELAAARESFYRLTLGQDQLENVGKEEAIEPESDERTRAWLVANLDFDHFSFRERRRIVDRGVDRVLELDKSLRGRVALVKFGLRENLVAFIERETDKQTLRAFQVLYRGGLLRFYLECVECRFEIPREIELRAMRQLVHQDNSPVEKSLFDIVPEESLNPLETEVALYLDKHSEVLWWYRNEVGPQHFSIQGYRRPKIYPDFVVQKGDATAKWKPTPTVLVVESKGAHLSGNADTLYKRDVADYFEKLGKSVSWQKLGAGFENATFRFQVLEGVEGVWKDQLKALLTG